MLLLDTVNVKVQELGDARLFFAALGCQRAQDSACMNCGPHTQFRLILAPPDASCHGHVTIAYTAEGLSRMLRRLVRLARSPAGAALRISDAASSVLVSSPWGCFVLREGTQPEGAITRLPTLRPDTQETIAHGVIGIVEVSLPVKPGDAGRMAALCNESANFQVEEVEPGVSAVLGGPIFGSQRVSFFETEEFSPCEGEKFSCYTSDTQTNLENCHGNKLVCSSPNVSDLEAYCRAFNIFGLDRNSSGDESWAVEQKNRFFPLPCDIDLLRLVWMGFTSTYFCMKYMHARLQRPLQRPPKVVNQARSSGLYEGIIPTQQLRHEAPVEVNQRVVVTFGVRWTGHYVCAVDRGLREMPWVYVRESRSPCYPYKEETFSYLSRNGTHAGMAKQFVLRGPSWACYVSEVQSIGGREPSHQDDCGCDAAFPPGFARGEQVYFKEKRDKHIRFAEVGMVVGPTTNPWGEPGHLRVRFLESTWDLHPSCLAPAAGVELSCPHRPCPWKGPCVRYNIHVHQCIYRASLISGERRKEKKKYFKRSWIPRRSRE
mmetsp:Transcript_91186/g.258229  ORF Transcript_91186/g.258229 Transcript_91186/m.258229 type:complete len:545 (+) Transcript_91186:198-1832(+)